MDKEKINLLAKDHANAFTRLTDLEGMVIRGQVLIESNLNRAIRLSVADNEEYKADKFSFSQILILGHMLGISTAFKAELNALNKLRNQIAHGTAFDEKYVDVIISEIKKKNPEIINLSDKKLKSLGTAISFICGALAVSPSYPIMKILLRKNNK